jgi:serine/alanine adding enzyme
MASVIVSPATDGRRWDAYVAGHPEATCDHLWGWRSVFDRALGHDTLYLQAERDGAIVGVLPLVLFRSALFGRCVISLPYLNYGGVVADDPDARDALIGGAVRAAEQLRASHVELRQIKRTAERLPFRQHKLRMSLPLPATSEALWTTIDRKIRNQIRKAQKESLTVETGGVELVDSFYAVFSENMRDLGTPVYSPSLFTETLRAFPEHAVITVVRLGERTLAGGLTVEFGNTVLNPWASSLRAYRPLCPNMLLYWAMLERAIARGSTTFDFGRSSPGGGTHQFKLQWGAREEPLHWEYVLLTRRQPPDQGPSSGKFDRIISLWKQLPLPIANLIGPSLAHHIP